MLTFALFIACTSTPDEKGNNSTGAMDTGSPHIEDPGETGDTAPAEETFEPVPVLWGVVPPERRVEDGALVEIDLTAKTDVVDLGFDNSVEAWTYGSGWPGPVIQIREGQTLRINFTNQLPDDETTIHWHGLRISDEMDGIPAIQDPVEPGETFVYEFTPPDPGTYWYHPHVRSNEQIERGLQGVLIVHETDAPVMDIERVFVLDDIAFDEEGAIASSTISPMESVHGRFGNRLLTNGALGVSTGEMRTGAVERWRIVNTANARTMEITVKGARWRVIAVDGTLLPEPYTANTLQVPVGRRFDLEVIQEASEVSLTTVLATQSGGTAQYPVFTATVTDEMSEVTMNGDWTEWNAGDLPALPEPTQTVSLEFDAYVNDATGLANWTINGEVFGDHEVLEVTQDTPSVITLKDLSGRAHPFHLHGQFFQVLSVDGVAPEHPALLDTVLINGESTIEIQTDFSNPGLWMAHCHILEHAEQGMMTQIRVGD
jgi:FtsP/CotA-like multicopper oxidase with cupredoxin domain